MRTRLEYIMQVKSIPSITPKCSRIELCQDGSMISQQHILPICESGKRHRQAKHTFLDIMRTLKNGARKILKNSMLLKNVLSKKCAMILCLITLTVSQNVLAVVRWRFYSYKLTTSMTTAQTTADKWLKNKAIFRAATTSLIGLKRIITHQAFKFYAQTATGVNGLQANALTN